MSRSHKARFRRYPSHHIWWMKNVRLASRQPSPRERTTAICAQLEEYLEDARQARLIAVMLEQERQRELREQTYVTFDAWDFEDCGYYESDAWYDPYEDHDFFDYESYEERQQFRGHFDELDDIPWDDGDIPCTDPRWVAEYLLGADTGYEERDDRYDFDDVCDGLSSCDSYESDGFWDYAWRPEDTTPTAALGLADHRQRERLKAGNRHFRSHR